MQLIDRLRCTTELANQYEKEFSYGSDEQLTGIDKQCHASFKRQKQLGNLVTIPAHVAAHYSETKDDRWSAA